MINGARQDFFLGQATLDDQMIVTPGLIQSKNTE